jgi:hypothetical protein
VTVGAANNPPGAGAQGGDRARCGLLIDRHWHRHGGGGAGLTPCRGSGGGGGGGGRCDRAGRGGVAG